VSAGDNRNGPKYPRASIETSASEEAPAVVHTAAIDEMKRRWVEQGRQGTAPMEAASWLLVSAQRLTARLEELLASTGLTLGRFDVLSTLASIEAGELGLRDLGDALKIHPTTVTYLIDQLERQQLVQRVRHPTDRRRTLARITPSGRKIVASASAMLSNANWGLTLDPGDFAPLADALLAVINELDANLAQDAIERSEK